MKAVAPNDSRLQFVARSAQDGPGNVGVADDVVGMPKQVRLAIEREGDVFTVEYSTDGGTTWTQPTGYAGGSLSLDLPSTVLLGLDVVSNDISVTATAEFDDFQLCCGTP